MAEERDDTGISPGISEDEDSDDEVSLLVVDEDELQTALDAAGISIEVQARCFSSSAPTTAHTYDALYQDIRRVELSLR